MNDIVQGREDHGEQVRFFIQKMRFPAEPALSRVLRDDPSKSDMHNRQGLSLKMIWVCIKDWRMWPLYLLGLTFLSKSPTLCSRGVSNLISRSPRHSTADLSHVVPPPTRLQHDRVEPAQRAFDRAWHHPLIGVLLPERTHRQSYDFGAHPASLGPSTAHCAVHLRHAYLELGDLRCRHANHRLSLRTSSTSGVGINELA